VVDIITGGWLPARQLLITHETVVDAQGLEPWQIAARPLRHEVFDQYGRLLCTAFHLHGL